MRGETANGYVGIILVSHSEALASGLMDLARQVAGPDVEIIAAAGGPDGSLGTDGARVLDALRRGARGSGAVVLMDLGSSVLSVKAALGQLEDEELHRLQVADAPFVEGTVAAAVTASTGATAAEVARAAEEARGVAKL
ncbi:MAG TPA: dihydroxyacetone kinase phosphoryl donor subunit DhaM [Gaiellaceae bacterium]|nr:dihydroxyacetone kinase phosphoryl donor subunit DhaM [Gaiellaceae bacterium]